ncbi:(2Fe-2S)-binding protein [Tropicimonas sp. IMCC34043]|uniref:(2Fe-2S)-binding protein n=1 Tax=Tropicimonas sp. IMCC34043 TaxID=2248760 RepID=UPI000E26C725|nr:(2Fe-2S)-binding protein [Tropicimonas sp. IMCC34043]
MIVCSCTRMTDQALADEVARILREDPQALITPGRVFHGLGERIQCGGCCRLIDMLIAADLRQRRAAADAPNDSAADLPMAAE